MKIRLIILLLFFGTTGSLLAENPNPERDSILSCINAIKNDSIRLEYERKQQQKYRFTPLGPELLDILYADARKVGNVEIEMAALLSYYSAATRSLDEHDMEKQLKRIEEHAYKNNMHNTYFKCNRNYLSYLASNGNMELVVNESRKMEKEAIRLKNNYGVISSKLSMAQAYKYARQDEKAIEVLEAVLTMDSVAHNEKFIIYVDVYNLLSNLKRYDEALKYLEMNLDLQIKAIKRDERNRPVLQPSIMHIETMYADAYMKLGQYSKAAVHLKRAEKYYKPQYFIVYVALYHSVHAAYYAHIQAWDLCMTSIDTAIQRLENEQPMLKYELIAQQISYLEQTGKFEKALQAHRELLFGLDSLYQSFIKKQEDVLAANYKWESGLVRQAQNSYILSLVTVVFVVLLLTMIIGFVVKLYVTNIQLRRARNEAVEAECVAIESDSLKNSLMKNISTEIDIPLRHIKKASEQTTSSPSISDKTLIRDIVKDAANLIKLLDLIVKYSKLEVGAIDFNVRRVDILGTCHQAVKFVRDSSNNQADICFTSQIDSQMTQIDSEWMMECLTTAMMIPNDSSSAYRLNFSVKYDNNGQMIIMEITGSPLSDMAFSGQFQSIKNQINNLFVENFGGTYEVQSSNLHPILTISLPLKDR